MKYILILFIFLTSNINAKSLYDKAMHAYANGEKQKAAQYFETSCNNGTIKSCHALANLYLRGNGVVKNTQKAIDLLENSCAALYTSSCLYLAFLYKDGTNVKQNDITSQYYFKIACRRGSKTACNATKSILIPINW